MKRVTRIARKILTDNPSVYETTIFGEPYKIRANFAQASSPIEIDTDDGWEPTQYQVGDFSHSAKRAMETLLREYLEDDLDDPEVVKAIDQAVRDMK